MAHFLSPIVESPDRYGLIIERTGVWLAHELEPAFSSAARNKGLLGRDSLPPECGLIIAPTQAVHTFGMRFAIDIIGVNRQGHVVKFRPEVPPRRLLIAWSAFAILELAAGQAHRSGLLPGDRLLLQRRD